MNSLTTDFPDRVITLSTGQPGLRGSIPVRIQPPDQIENQKSKIENPDAPILDFISSDETLDRHSEIITASGWRLESYRRNPVFQNSHQYGDIIFTLGKALVTEVRQLNGRACLYQRIEFAVDANPIAKIAYALYRGGYINTVSVGFIPLRWQDLDPSGPAAAETLALTGTQPHPEAPPLPNGRSGSDGEGRGEGNSNNPPIQKSNNPSRPCRRRYLEQELLEVSAVAIPANPNALALALKSGAIERATLAETLDLLRHSSPNPVHPVSPVHPVHPVPPSLIRELHSILTS